MTLVYSVPISVRSMCFYMSPNKFQDPKASFFCCFAPQIFDLLYNFTFSYENDKIKLSIRKANE